MTRFVGSTARFAGLLVLFSLSRQEPCSYVVCGVVERAPELDQKRRTIPVACVQMISSRGHDLHAVKEALEGQYSHSF